MAAPVVASITTAAKSSQTWVGTKPSGVAENDLLVTHFTLDQADAVTTLAGWTLLHGPVDPIGVDVRAYVFTKIATGSEPSSYTWGVSTGTRSNPEGALCILRITGVDTITTVDVSDTSTQDDNAVSTHESATIVTTVADALALFFCSADESSPKSRPYWQNISGMNTEYDFEGDSTVYAGCYSQTISTAQSVQRTATTSSSDTSSMVIMAIRPSSAPAPSGAPPLGGLASTGVGK